MPSKFFMFLIAAGILLATPRLAVAYSCVEVPPAEAFAHADVVFVGTAIETKPTPPVQDLGPGPISSGMVFGAMATRFSIQESFLAVDGTEIVVHETGGSSDVGFDEGKQYLVYAHRVGDGRLFTSICSRTAFVNEAKKDLVYLRRVKTRQEPGIVTGRVTRLHYDAYKHRLRLSPVRNARVVFTSGGTVWTATTNRRGKFDIRGLPKGSYRVWTEPESNSSNLGQYDEHGITRWQADVPGHGTMQIWFSLEPTAKVQGRVLDAKGCGVAHVDIEIVPVDGADSPIKSQSKWTGPDGRFTFEALWPGEYVLGFNLDGDPSLDDPYPRYYYPVVGEPHKAAAIVLADGGAVTGIELRLPLRLREFQVTGVAVWPDGSLARHVAILLRHPRTGYQEGNFVETDGRGRFAITGLEGVVYHLVARTLENGVFLESAPVAVAPGPATGPVRFVVRLRRR